MTPDGECECICNHSGACTGCGICFLKAFGNEQQILSMFGLPPLRPTIRKDHHD